MKMMCYDAKLSPQPLCDHTCTAAVISLAATVNVSAFKKGVINVFSMNIGISGLQEIWITPDELHGSILCFLSIVFFTF